ncbi:MAG: hypothetical protein A2487_20395 [Candidatus Raymondbacteria bacterium RifOxyC12_full_50_8]|uniref:Glycosyltransferase RgtA/B/C/D-like domain-containing protein n=1 Tax=Candidatus Raymondbacteria bacterium RIFOXYD12_FULL_49_13 TaxID=1817890 RepID=A0A1F7FA06_UNCRA|nr:MAG: hypothetical protein A2248_22360 [Candidatus Raymondbacteria bacterium RIFOXYA2_FULL_49_16]OGJ94003.1 MAG: hypothetical protein A2350_19560 [Candidatus Raymondbacteria bacterium RifOxyB12_full_50_8]OGJ96437.1 MAG: hypothetical protein A2487_20395 [Candidatus Raymondbacteria bacterium RifOxyC12_full_50_8]OGK03509.1 MAG: hypothetical protein A2519_09755 [Candidatus Raymondbacteria bacterium RIFOXYD12_FULL_49_13]OGP42818.1 MAG: hypothetical protein A2324_16045 [Candidatus Raymondbacteria b
MPVIISSSVKQTTAFNARDPARILFLALLILPISWSFRTGVQPIQDLPNHVANAKILLNYGTSPLFQEFFTLHWAPYPYLLQDLLLMLFIKVGNPDFAGNALLALAMVSIPLSVLFMLKTFNPRKTYLCFFSLPFTWNILVWKGNCNYLLGISLSYICLAMLWKILCTEKPPLKQWAYFTLCCLLLYCAHIVALVLFMALALIIVLPSGISIADMLHKPEIHENRKNAGRFIMHSHFLCFIPVFRKKRQ